tara:strand:+ start:1171 stop:1485 length:315 start_codon:yes stop_codon:yes gene_type:complete
MKTNHTYTKIVRQLLMTKPLMRDNDNSLIANVWSQELKKKGFDIAAKPTIEFFIEFSKNKLACAETIRRTRAKLQQERPDLRGKNYKIRQDHEKNVKDHLSQIK